MGEDRDHDDFGPALQGFYFLFAEDCNVALNSVELNSNPIRTVREYFVDNLHASVSVISIPFLMADAAVLNSRFDRIFLAENIRAQRFETRHDESSEAEREEILRSTRTKYRAFLDSAEAADFRRDSVLSHLTQALRDEKFRRASEQLLREALVMVWSSFETLSSDLFRELVNACPYLASVIIGKEKGLFANVISFVDLSAYEYNMLGKMGDFLLRERGLDSLIAIRRVFSAIFPDHERMSQMLKDELLWKLWHRRHVVVHRRGRIDETYIRQTGDKSQKLGDLLNIHRNDIDETILFLCQVAREMLLSADCLLAAERK